MDADDLDRHLDVLKVLPTTLKPPNP